MSRRFLPAVIIAILISIIIFDSICDILEKGYSRSGFVWYNTVEKALSVAAGHPSNDAEELTIAELIDEREIDDLTTMLFVSECDTLTSVTFVTNEQGKYSMYGYTVEYDLTNPTEFLLNGKKDQSILIPYETYNDKVYGWCYTSASFTVNGHTPSRETYIFECGGKEWSIDFWMLTDFPEEQEVSIECQT